MNTGVRTDSGGGPYFKGDGENRLPPAAAIGLERQALSLVGRGAARVFHPVLTPQVLGGRPYVAIDMGVDGQFFPDRRSGLMRLYGTDIRSDGRRVVAFARDARGIVGSGRLGRRWWFG